MAKKKKAIGRFPKRPRSRSRKTDYTLQELKDLVAKYGPEQLTAKEMEQLNKIRKQYARPKKDAKEQEPPSNVVPFQRKKSIKERLAEFQQEALDLLFLEARKGSGIARMQAIGSIKEWAEQRGAWAEERQDITVCFDDAAMKTLADDTHVEDELCESS